jgi:hypothetical protein
MDAEVVRVPYTKFDLLNGETMSCGWLIPARSAPAGRRELLDPRWAPDIAVDPTSLRSGQWGAKSASSGKRCEVTDELGGVDFSNRASHVTIGEVEAQMLAGLAPEEQQQFRHLLERCIASLRAVAGREPARRDWQKRGDARGPWQRSAHSGAHH